MTIAAVDRLARIRDLEQRRAVLAAEQATEAAALVAESRAAVEVEIATVPRPGVGSRRRREQATGSWSPRSPSPAGSARPQAQRWVTWALEAPAHTPRTFALLAAGAVSEQRAKTVHRGVASLAPDDRRLVDVGIAANLDRWGDREVERETHAAVQHLDPAGACEHAAHAESERRVTSRLAPETMAWLTTLAPMTQVVACRAALEDAARAARAAGDPRSRGQIMADTLVERVTGQTSAPAVPVAIQLVITDRTLLGVSDLPARLADGSPLPAPLARALTLDSDAPARVRRLFTDPMGRLVTAETDSRRFTRAMAEFIALRDGGTCTTDWCDAPIRHTDHVHPHASGGPTSIGNGRGTCVRCNITKADRISPASPPPIRPAPRRRRRPRRSVERRARHLIAAAVRKQRRAQQQPATVRS